MSGKCRFLRFAFFYLFFYKEQLLQQNCINLCVCERKRGGIGRKSHCVFSLLYFNLFPFLIRLEEGIVGKLASLFLGERMREGGRRRTDKSGV